MSYSVWLNYLKSATISSVIQKDVRKVLYRFPDEHEMLEEYSMTTGIILKRAWKRKRALWTASSNDASSIGDGQFKWEYELGDFMRPLNQSQSDFVVKESTSEVTQIVNHACK